MLEVRKDFNSLLLSKTVEWELKFFGGPPKPIDPRSVQRLQRILVFQVIGLNRITKYLRYPRRKWLWLFIFFF